MEAFLAAILQFFDYVVKAILNYRKTEQGEKEWQDIFNALNQPEEPEQGSSFVDSEVRNVGDVPTPEDIAVRITKVIQNRK